MSSIALLGGAFDPPHFGHLKVCEGALDCGIATDVWLLPSCRHPAGKLMSSFDDRVKMCELLAAHVAGGISVNTCERDLPGNGYTVDILRKLRRENRASKFVLLLGGDAAKSAPKWKGWHEIEAMCKVVVFQRSEIDAQFPAPVSSSRIRSDIALGVATADFLPATIIDYAIARGLYARRANSP